MRPASVVAAVAMLAPGALAQGSDDCASPQVIASLGLQPFDQVSAATGAEGQANPCGGIELDLWFTWTAAVNGHATVSTCLLTYSVNTKLAVYAGAGCPTGLALACDDDMLCGGGLSEARLSFPVTLGAAYTIQLGSSPGFPGGTGWVDVIEVASPGAMTTNCFPGTNGVIACPCGQLPNPSGGCANFGAGATSGAQLFATGYASLGWDSLVLQSVNHRRTPAGTLNLFFASQGSLSTGVALGAGVRCVGAPIVRLYAGQTVLGSIGRPAPGDPSVSARSAQLGAPISIGETRHYFNVYRDPAATGPCGSTASNVNTTNAGSVPWTP